MKNILILFTFLMSSLYAFGQVGPGVHVYVPAVLKKYEYAHSIKQL